MARSRTSVAALFRPLSGPSARSRASRSAADNPAIQAIWDVIAAIPRGRVSTYGAIARAAGYPGRARQAGLAVKIAPADLNLPWYRVVRAGGHIAFPRSSSHHKQQVRLLRAEGVTVRDGRVERSALIELQEP